MQSITPQEFCQTLYCATAAVDAFTIVDGNIAFVATAVNGGKKRDHHVVCEAVQRVERSDADKTRGPSERLELSVIEAAREASGWRLWVNPWYIEEVEIHCARLILDGHPVAGEGRWLQDELPSGSAA